MKKTLIALAALASVSAFAQSSVTISGKLRYAYITNSSTASGTTTKAAGIGRTDGDVVFTATEDLGGGLKANFQLEQSIKVDRPTKDRHPRAHFQGY